MPVWMDARGDRGEGARERERESEIRKKEKKERKGESAKKRLTVRRSLTISQARMGRGAGF